ncbi:MAG: putative quinol monooxygenase [Acidimicrobiales bacterium]|nr:putative quinol monooxygenase [Acidimicrobiales bacterium]MDG1878367.1 putative quinol monooxygenase [Acidimicrobiales bacterium]
MSKTAMIAKLPLKEGARDAFLAAYEGMNAQVVEEVGTEIYILHFDRKDENVAYIYELYRDVDSLKQHGGTDAMKAFQGAIGDLLGGMPELISLTPETGKGL